MQWCSSLAALQLATLPGTRLHVKQCVCVCVCMCVCGVHTLKFVMHIELLLESIVEQGAVEVLCSSLSAHERHQGVQAVALRTPVLLTEDGKAVCVRVRVCVCVCVCVCARARACPANCSAVYLCIQYIRNIILGTTI